MKVKKININTFQFDEEGVRFFLLNGEKLSLLIDSGMETKNAKDIVSKYTDKPLYLINTHADIDHIGSNSQFEWSYMHPSECIHYNGKIHAVWDQQKIDLGNRMVQIIHMPGHTPGSIAILDMDNRILFSGDPIQKEGKIFMFGPMRSLQANICSLERLEQMDSFDYLYPSHACCPIQKSVISEIKRGCIDILEQKVSYHEVEIFGNKVKAYNIGTSVILAD